jgi:hypothetical protein
VSGLGSRLQVCIRTATGRKGTFVGYSESSKAYRIYILGQRQIDVSRDVTFEEEITFRRSRESHMEINSEKKEGTIPSPPSAVQRETVTNPIDLVALADVPRDIAVGPEEACMGSTNSVGGRGTCNSSWYIPREQETTEIFKLCFSHEPHQ